MQETNPSKAGYALITNSASFLELLTAVRGNPFDAQSLNQNIAALKETVAAEPQNKHAANILKSLEAKITTGAKESTQQLFTYNLESINSASSPADYTVYGSSPKGSDEIVFQQSFTTRPRGGTTYFEDMATHRYWFGFPESKLKNAEYGCKHLPIDPNLVDKDIKFELKPQELTIYPELSSKFRGQSYTVLQLIPKTPEISTPIMAVFMLEGQKIGNIDPMDMPNHLINKTVIRPVHNITHQEDRIHAITSQFLNLHLR